MVFCLHTVLLIDNSTVSIHRKREGEKKECIRVTHSASKMKLYQQTFLQYLISLVQSLGRGR